MKPDHCCGPNLNSNSPRERRQVDFALATAVHLLASQSRCSGSADCLMARRTRLLHRFKCHAAQDLVAIKEERRKFW